MAYEKQTWIDDNTYFPLSANRLTHLEEGLESVDKKILVLELNEPVPVGTAAGTIIIRKQA